MYAIYRDNYQKNIPSIYDNRQYVLYLRQNTYNLVFTICFLELFNYVRTSY